MANNVKVAGSVMWANLNKVNEMSGKYQFDLCNISAAGAKAIESLGLDVKHKDDKGNYIILKSSNPIRAFHPDGSIVDESTLIGNGTKVQVVVGAYDWKFKGKAGRSPSCVKMVVTELVVYGDNPVEDLEVEDDMVL